MRRLRPDRKPETIYLPIFARLAILGTKHKDGFEPYWQDEKDWLCIVEFLPTDNPEARGFAADMQS